MPNSSNKGTELVARSWETISGWLEENVPNSATKLGPGASPGDIERAENAMNIKLPEDVRLSYLMHDGSGRLRIWGQAYVMPLYRPTYLPKKESVLYNEVVDSWQFMNEMLDGGNFSERSSPRGLVCDDWWNVNWIPLTSNDSGDHVCVDLSPAKGGTLGQIVEWSHEIGAVKVIAKSFSEWLAVCAKSFVDGLYVYDHKKNWIRRRSK